jgi:two-component system response regulator HydG
MKRNNLCYLPGIAYVLRQKKLTKNTESPIVAVAVGSGMIVRAAVEAGADLLLAFNAGLYRTAGTGSLAAFLPYGNANQQTETLLRSQVFPCSSQTPVVAGVFPADPTIDLCAHLNRLKALGVYGVTNWPSLGFVDGKFREILEEEGFDTESELRMLTDARQLGLAAYGFVHTAEDVARFAPCCDGLILNLGLTRQIDDVQDHRDRLQNAITRLQRMIAAMPTTAHRPLTLVFGGPITTPDDFQQVVRQCHVDGFAGGSVFERLPVRRAVESTLRKFKSVSSIAAHDQTEDQFGNLIGRTPVMKELFALIKRVAKYDVSVCIEGETGTGKELVATEIHRLSSRSSEPFVTLNCGAIPETLVESEFFGYERGAFTGAHRQRLGKFELANRGTLFLDEVADLSSRAQVALLRVLQQGEIVRLGSDKPTAVNVRIITASHQNLERCVAEGRFRADLYHRLNQIMIHVPRLADRRDDIPLLIRFFIARLRTGLGRELDGVSKSFEQRLTNFNWPGNVRELEHVIGRAAILEDSPWLMGNSFQPPCSDNRPQNPVVSQPRREQAIRAIADADGNKAEAARSLGISRKTLYSWMNESAEP